MTAGDSAITSAGAGALLVVAKATAVLVLAAGAAFVARDASAARRHLVWLVALVACGALIPSSLVGRTIPVRWPALVATAPRGTAVASRSSPSATAHALPFAVARRERGADASVPTSSHPHVDDDVAVPAPRLIAFALAVWLFGALACALRVGVAYRTIARIVAHSRELDARRWAGETSGVPAWATRRAVSVRVAAAVRSPFAAGIVRPTILLPLDAEGWTVERRRAVLAHEMAHVARADAATQAIGLAVCAIYWFHPLAWLALSRLRAEAEHAADDRVLVDVMPPVSYAGHLVDVARAAGGSTTMASLAVGMIAIPPLERRVRAMLDQTRSRAGVSPRARTLTVSLAAAVVIPVGALRTIYAPATPTRAAAAFGQQRPASRNGELPRVASRRTGTGSTFATAEGALVAAADRDRPAPGRTMPALVSLPSRSATAPDDELPRPAVVPVERTSAAHPDFEGTWVLPWSRAACPPSWSASSCATTLVIAQSESSIAMTSQRPARSNHSIVGTFHATMWVPFDGSAATFTGAVNGIPLNAVSYTGRWIGDTLVTRIVLSNDRGLESGAVEYGWLSSDRKTLYWRSVPWAGSRALMFDSTWAFTRK